MAEINFDPTSIPQDDFPSFDPIPPGEYELQVIESELKPTKAGTGVILKLTLEVTKGAHTGRRIFDNLNVQNPNPQAEQISKRSLADLCFAVGYSSTVRDSEMLHFRPFMAKVTIQPSRDPQFGPSNRVRYPAAKVAQAEAPPWVAPQPAAKPPGNGTATVSRPWAQPKPRV